MAFRDCLELIDILQSSYSFIACRKFWVVSHATTKFKMGHNVIPYGVEYALCFVL